MNAHRKSPKKLADRAFPLILGSVALVLLVFLAFHRGLHFGFQWDDDYHVTSNACVVGPWGFREIWTTNSANFFPFVLSTLRLENMLWGINPHLFHLVTIIFHCCTAVVLWRVLKELSIPGAWIGAAIWCVHPLQSESTLWISEQKNTESALFYLLSILCYLKSPMRVYAKPDRYYLGSLLFALLAITSKTSTVILPGILLLCTWWKDQKNLSCRVFLLIPYFFISGVASYLTILEQKFHVGAVGHEYTLDWVQRVGLAGTTPWFYLWKFITPWSLCFIYPKWSASELVPLGWFLLVGWASILLLLFGYQHRHNSQVAKATFFALACFLISLLPVLGLFDGYFFRYSYVSDHFQYLASMATAGGCGAIITLLTRRSGTSGMFFLTILILLFTALITIDIKDSQRFKDRDSLWKNTVSRNSGCWMAMNNLGNLRYAEGNKEEAVAWFEKSCAIHTQDEGVWNNLAVIAMDSGRFDEAKVFLDRALAIDAKNSKVLSTFSKYYLHQGNESMALDFALRAATSNNLNTEACCMAASLLIRQGRYEEGEHMLSETKRNSPRDINAYLMLASLLENEGRLKDESVEYQKILDIYPDNPQAIREYSRLLIASDPIRAEQMLFDYLKKNSSDFNAWNILAMARISQGNTDGAQVSLARSLEISADQPEAMRYQALLKASKGFVKEATEIAIKADYLARKQKNLELSHVLQKDLSNYRSGEQILINTSP